MIRRAVIALAALSLAATTAAASPIADPGAAGFQPRVPISLLAAPMQWFDASRLHFSNTVTVGSGSWGTSALNVTALQYQFKAPVTMQVRLGTEFGPQGADSQGASVFLEGLDMTWRPSGNSMLRVQWRDVRSPLQYGHGSYGFGTPDPWFSGY